MKHTCVQELFLVIVKLAQYDLIKFLTQTHTLPLPIFHGQLLSTAKCALKH